MIDVKSALRDAAEEFAKMDTREYCQVSDNDWRMRMLILFARHYLATVPADDADPVTVKQLEAWGGEPVPDSLPSQKHERRFMSIHGQSFRCVNRGGTWVVDVYVIGSGWRFATADRNTVGEMRQTLEGLGIKLKGGA